MSSRLQLSKVLLDIEDCVSELKRQSVDGRTPINDDFVTLHRFQEKLELILLFGLIEKPGLLGPKKSYWNYIYACLTSSKRSHDGLNFVKSILALKTPLGRGRAFIRYCLTQKCLADTLQNCFMDEKISRDFYAERSLPVQKEYWSSLVSCLYELNELDFDLCTGHTELDISWPKFARKLFTSDSENFQYRKRSTSNLYCFSSEDEHNYEQNSDCLLEDCSYTAKENLDGFKLTQLNEELSQQNKILRKEVQCLEDEKSRLQFDIETLQKKYLSLQQQLNSCEEKQEKAKTDQVSPEIKDVSTSPSHVTIKVINTDSSTKVEERTIENILEKFEENHNAVCVSPSVKSKIKCDRPGNSTECALPQNDHEIPAVQTLSSVLHNVGSEHFQRSKNIHIPQNSICVNELLLEMKTVIDDLEGAIQNSDITLAIPHISRLKNIKSFIEERVSSEMDKSKSCLNFSNLVENFITCIKNFATKQETVINSFKEKIDISIKGNQNLYSRIKTLKDLLLSYGFLKVVNEKEVEPENILLPLDAPPSSNSSENFFCDIANDPLLKRMIVPLLPVLNSSFTKLNSLNEKMIELQFGLDSSRELNNYLITRVQDQEMHLKGVTKEIEEAQQLVSVLKKQHRKLQSAEGILKYDLQEKRKLLTRLKQQLENTREDFNLVRIKNSKSEAEWQDLRKEFVERHKQTSEESGFVDDKSLEDHENSACDFSIPHESTPEKAALSKKPQDTPTKRKRLELLEEQCQHLYSNLLKSAKRREEIDKRLESMCKTIARNNEVIAPNTFSTELSVENTAANLVIQTSSEDNCQNVMLTQEELTNSPHSSSHVGSLNSECSTCIPSLCNNAKSSDSFSCDSSKADTCISFSSDLLIGAIHPVSTCEQGNEIDSLSDLHSNSDCHLDCEDNGDMICCESLELTANNIQNSHLQSMPHVDSILVKKKNLEESLKNLEIDDEIVYSEEKDFPQSEEFSLETASSQHEEKKLLNKVQELERRILILSTELDQTTQQLILSKAAKEHEVAALQFQLNTQALKYERSLKEFSDQNEGLENMKQRVTEQEQLILALEDALSEIRSDRENEKEHQWQELEDIHIALEVREQECISLCQELQKSMSEVEQEHNRNKILLSQLEEFKMYNQKDKEIMEAEITQMKQYSGELQKKLVKLLKEKDILWKRNDHLHHLQKIKIDDRWINDSEVSRCLGCKNNFSFMLRKHHCRLCGRIFCYSCSNNWLSTASSSKKIRACNECFVQHMEIKKVVRRGSDVPHIDDDSDEAENGYLSLIPTGSNSFNSDVPSSITDSVISLPITQKQSTPHFASAPDLRYVFKPNDTVSISFEEENLKDKEVKIAVVNDDISKNSEVSSDDCTSITLEEDIPKICRLKEISVDEIKSHEYGLSGKFVINPQERDDLPIFCHTSPVVLKWSLTSNSHNIPLTITHEDEKCKSSPAIFYQALDKMQDQIELNLPGYYILHFDNTARSTEMEVHYILYIEH